MTLENVTALFYDAEKFLKKVVAEAASGLELREIIEEIEKNGYFNPREYDSVETREIVLNILEGNYKVRINERETVLTGRWGIEVKRFNSEEAGKYFSSLINKVKESEEDEDLPF